MAHGVHLYQGPFVYLLEPNTYISEALRGTLLMDYSTKTNGSRARADGVLYLKVLLKQSA